MRCAAEIRRENTINGNKEVYKCIKHINHQYAHAWRLEKVTMGDMQSSAFSTTVGPDAPIVENERGGKQSRVAYRYDLIPPEVLKVLSRIYDYGAKRYPDPDNWKKISTEDHLNHVLVHLVAYREGDKSDDHLGHMMWRAQAALWTAIHDLGYDARQLDEKIGIDEFDKVVVDIPHTPTVLDSLPNKKCVECGENSVRYPGSAYCQECYDKSQWAERNR